MLIGRFGPAFNQQGLADHRLACGDATGAAAAFGDAMQLAAAAMSEASPRTQPELVSLMTELRAGRKKAAALSAALAEVDWEHARIFGAPPLEVSHPGGGGSGAEGAEHEPGLHQLAGQLQAVLEARAPGRWRLQVTHSRRTAGAC